MIKKIGIYGGGSWGTALGALAVYSGSKTLIFTRESKIAEEINNSHTNSPYLGQITLPMELKATTEVQRLKDVDIIIIATPSKAFNEVLLNLQNLNLSPNISIIIATKGLCTEPLCFLSEQAEKKLTQKISFIVGPSFAHEVAKNMYTHLVIASKNEELAQNLSIILTSKNLHITPCYDIITVQIASIVKNIIAIISGMYFAYGYGENAKAALISRALKEIALLSRFFGGEDKTLIEPAVVGDLVLTATSRASRNMEFGYKLASNAKIEHLLNKSSNLVEGVRSAFLIDRFLDQYQDLKQQLPLIYEVINKLEHKKIFDFALKNNLI